MTMSRNADHDTSGPRQSMPRASAVHGVHGLLMGSADIIPGVSGGTVALILGIYERLIDSIHAVASALVAFGRRDRAAGIAHWRRADLGLVVPLAAGILGALAIGSVVLPPLIEQEPVITSAVFFGLIAGALPIPWRRIGVRDGSHPLLALAGGVLAFALAGLAPATVEDPSLPLVFAAAAVAICAMILPGVSGAYLLLVMGMYEVTLEAAGRLDIVYVGVFAAGAIAGLAAFSKLLAWLLDQRHDATMAVLVGLMAGSLRRLWPWQDHAGTLQVPAATGEVAVALGCVLIGLAVVTALVRFGDRSGRAAGTDG